MFAMHTHTHTHLHINIYIQLNYVTNGWVACFGDPWVEVKPFLICFMLYALGHGNSVCVFSRTLASGTWATMVDIL